jgi:hypothetical protein
MQLIVVELGGVWPAWLGQPGSNARRVVSEMEGETPAAFATRVAAELPQQPELGSAVLLCNERADAAQLEARRALSKALLGALPALKPATLTLSALASASDRSKRALTGLTSELGRRVTLRLESEANADAISRVAVA